MNLFKRHKDVEVDLVDTDKFKITSSLNDLSHEINIELLVDIESGTILAAKAQFFRQPNLICTETACLVKKLVGVSLTKGITSKAKELVGGPKGCTHLPDLVIEAAKAYFQGKVRKSFHDIGDIEKARAELNENMKGNCWFHTRHLRA